ncbi:hypothetical protein NDU88_002273 [Pleurodeles waltl]|uniref:Uncharacterized protein n=1 Tax=Pleurodeles waltl TaxID=8319 RepID=A0AAV7W3K8_PLEWA|nr:hypothetical protein NDU88_002273 [Pleurodeles waltl]
MRAGDQTTREGEETKSPTTSHERRGFLSYVTAYVIGLGFCRAEGVLAVRAEAARYPLHEEAESHVVDTESRTGCETCE